MGKTYRNKKKDNHELYNKFIQSKKSYDKKMSDYLSNEIEKELYTDHVIESSLYLDRALLIAKKYNLESEVENAFVSFRLKGFSDSDAIDMALRETNIWWDS